jgi:zinc protease
MAEILISENLFPEGHPYHWPVIGSMADLSAASYDDVVDFFKKYYSTRNASLAVVGDIDTGKTRELIEYWFKDVPAGDPVPPPGSPAVYPTAEKRVIYEDRVQLPRVYMCWISPALYNPGDAEMDVLASILADGKNSRLYKRVVYDLQIAQDVSAYQASQALVSSFQVVATARSGHSLSEIERVIQEEINKIKIEPPTRRELQRVVNQYESSFLSRLENIGRVAYQLNGYYTKTGNPDYFNEDLTRYRALDPDDILSVAKTYLRDDGRMILSVVPQGKRELAATPSMEVK